jgi:hypothetical protein
MLSTAFVAKETVELGFILWRDHAHAQVVELCDGAASSIRGYIVSSHGRGHWPLGLLGFGYTESRLRLPRAKARGPTLTVLSGSRISNVEARAEAMTRAV